MSVRLDYQTVQDCWKAMVIFFANQVNNGLWAEEYPALRSAQNDFIASIWTTSDVLYTIIQHRLWTGDGNEIDGIDLCRLENKLIEDGVNRLIEIFKARQNEASNRVDPILEEIKCLVEFVKRNPNTAREDYSSIHASAGRSILRNQIAAINEANHLAVFPRAIPIPDRHGAEQVVASGRASHLSSAAALQVLCSYYELNKTLNNEKKRRLHETIEGIVNHFIDDLGGKPFLEAVSRLDDILKCSPHDINSGFVHNARIDEIKNTIQLHYTILKKKDNAPVIEDNSVELVSLGEIPDKGIFLSQDLARRRAPSSFPGWTGEYHRVWNVDDLERLSPDAMSTLYILQGLSFIFRIHGSWDPKWLLRVIKRFVETMTSLGNVLENDLISNGPKNYDYFCRRIVSLIMICRNMQCINKNCCDEVEKINALLLQCDNNLIVLVKSLIDKIKKVAETSGMRAIHDPMVVSAMSGLDIVQVSGADLSMVTNALFLAVGYLEENNKDNLLSEKDDDSIIPSILRKCIDALENQLYYSTANSANGGYRWAYVSGDGAEGIYLWNSAYAARAFSDFLQYSHKNDYCATLKPVAVVIPIKQAMLDKLKNELRITQADVLHEQIKRYPLIAAFAIVILFSPYILEFVFRLVLPIPASSSFCILSIMAALFCLIEYFYVLKSSPFERLLSLMDDKKTSYKIKKILLLNHFVGIPLYLTIIFLLQYFSNSADLFTSVIFKASMGIPLYGLLGIVTFVKNDRVMLEIINNHNESLFRGWVLSLFKSTIRVHKVLKDPQELLKDKSKNNA